MDEKRLGKRLQEARRTAGMTQQMLCQRADLSYSTLAKIERGAIRSPSIFTIQSIAIALNVSLDELIGDSVSDKPRSQKYQTSSKSGVKFIYFDVNGCLVRFFHRAFVKIALDTGQPEDVTETVFWHYNDQVCRGEMSISEFNAVLAKQLGVKNLSWPEYYYEAVDPVPEMHGLVKWVGRNYQIGLITNIMPGFINELTKRGLIPDVHYDSIIDSSVVGSIKPESKIYEIAQEKANCLPAEILLIDDSRTNLMAAEKFGWHVLWFDDYNSEESISGIRNTLKPVAKD
jgi:FMN phosphatase YigB (HAD superfamily)/DNA-binding XRE family transcriptional regulator